jgi:hypothetical protein
MFSSLESDLPAGSLADLILIYCRFLLNPREIKTPAEFKFLRKLRKV